MNRARMKAQLRANYLSRGFLIGIACLLTVAYVAQFQNPPFPAIVPVGFWFFCLTFLFSLTVIRGFSTQPRLWHQPIAIGISLVLTLGVYLAGLVGEQQVLDVLHGRQLSE